MPLHARRSSRKRVAEWKIECIPLAARKLERLSTYDKTRKVGVSNYSANRGLIYNADSVFSGLFGILLNS